MKRCMSLRFNLDKEDERMAWEYLQSLDTSRNKAVIAAINASLEPVNFAIIKAVKEAVQDCLRNISFAQMEQPVEISKISEDETALLDSLDDLLGG